jgi:tetratricopeptide (TPR) repeat protein
MRGLANNNEGTVNLITNLRTRFSSFLLQPIWVHLGLIVLVGITVYSNSFRVPLILDDNYTISYLGSSKISDLILHGSSRRVADVTFALNNYVHGFWLPGYHITNLVIHLATAITLYLFVHAAIESLRGTREARSWTFVEQFVPFATALLFVCHPLQTQAVTYIIQRYTSLAALLYLLSALAFVRARYAFDQGQIRRKTWLWGGISLIAALLAVGCKQIALTLPLMLILLEGILFRGRLLNRRFYIVCGALFLIIPAFLLFEWQQGTLDDFLYDLRQATSDNNFISRGTYFLTQTRVVATYLRLLFLPINQNLLYDYPIYRSLFSAPILASLALHCTLVITAIFLLHMSRKSRCSTDWQCAACLRLAALGIAWFYIALAVESSIIPIRDVIFEHRVYLPSVGFFITITAISALAVRNRHSGERSAWILLTVLCLLLGGMTIARNHIWNDALGLWQDTAQKSPNKGIVLANLGSEYLHRGMPDKSLRYFSRAIEVNPNLDFRAKSGLGISLQGLNIFRSRFTTGQEYILAGGLLNGGTLDFSKLPQWDSVIANNRGLAYEYLGEYEKAWNVYENAVWINPAYDLAWYNLGLLSFRLGDKNAVAKAVGRLKTLNPPLAQELESLAQH